MKMELTMDGISDILGKLTDSDMAALQEAAQAMFGGQQNAAETPRAQDAPASPFAGISPALLARISSLMGAMNQRDSRSDLILAMKPHLSPSRRKRADEAVQMMRLFELLPMLQKTMSEND